MIQYVHLTKNIHSESLSNAVIRVRKGWTAPITRTFSFIQTELQLFSVVVN